MEINCTTLDNTTVCHFRDSHPSSSVTESEPRRLLQRLDSRHRCFKAFELPYWLVYHKVLMPTRGVLHVALHNVGCLLHLFLLLAGFENVMFIPIFRVILVGRGDRFQFLMVEDRILEITLPPTHNMDVLMIWLIPRTDTTAVPRSREVFVLTSILRIFRLHICIVGVVAAGAGS